MVGSFRNLTFLPIIIGNTVIGIVQEIRAKKTLEKMSLLNAPHADVIRNGSVKQISTDELVKDDVILLTAGKQICADAIVISGNIQVNESLLTGEADEVENSIILPSKPYFAKCSLAFAKDICTPLHTKICVSKRIIPHLCQTPKAPLPSLV